jgi:hypothetical protein
MCIFICTGTYTESWILWVEAVQFRSSGPLHRWKQWLIAFQGLPGHDRLMPVMLCPENQNLVSDLAINYLTTPFRSFLYVAHLPLSRRLSWFVWFGSRFSLSGNSEISNTRIESLLARATRPTIESFSSVYDGKLAEGRRIQLYI